MRIWDEKTRRWEQPAYTDRLLGDIVRRVVRGLSKQDRRQYLAVLATGIVLDVIPHLATERHRKEE